VELGDAQANGSDAAKPKKVSARQIKERIGHVVVHRTPGEGERRFLAVFAKIETAAGNLCEKDRCTLNS
jgi:hypothetical protein